MSRDSARARNFILQTVGLVWPSAVLLPQLRGAWLFSSVNVIGDLIDTSGNGKRLTNTGTVTFGVDDYMPYGILNGSSQYFTRDDETHFDVTDDLTIIHYSFFDNTASAVETMVAKWRTDNNQRSYVLYRDANGKAVFDVSSNGTAITTAVSTTAIASGNWAFVAGRYTAGSETAIFLGYQGADEGVLEKVINTTSIPASLKDSTASFRIGAQQSGFTTPSLMLTGRAGMTFFCAAALSDNFINMVYSQSRTILGV